MGIVERFTKAGYRVITADAVHPEQGKEATSHMPKRLFWGFGQRLLGSAMHLLKEPIDGLVQVTCFGCGPDSMVGEIVERYAQRESKVPFLYLTVDEHTGEAGIVTRLEAFLDLMVRRRNHEGHLPPHGSYGPDYQSVVQ